MASGRRAFEGDTVTQVWRAVLSAPPATLPVSVALQAIIIRCLEKHPAARFQSMSEVKAALQGVMNSDSAQHVIDPRPSIAVLPFANMSADAENEHFSDGLAEEIINALARIHGLKVIARTSAFAFKGQNVDVRHIAATLGVTNVLEGSVRKAGNRIRVTAQLIVASDGSHLWSERFDRELTDVFAIQDEIADAISRALRSSLTHEPVPERKHTPPVSAYEAYLEARQLWGRLTFDAVTRAWTRLQRALEIDPEYAEAHAFAGRVIVTAAIFGARPATEAMPAARQAAERALAMDPQVAEAHVVLGLVNGLYDYKWQEAERCFVTALELQPSSAVFRHIYGMFCLAPLRRFDEAIAQHERALRDDPLNVVVRYGMCQVMAAAGRYDVAKRELQHVVEMDKNFAQAYFGLAFVAYREGRYTDAMTYVETSLSLPDGVSLTGIGLMAILHAQQGDEQKARQVMSMFPAHVRATGDAWFQLLRGNCDEAADSLRQAIGLRHPMIPLIVESSWPGVQALRESRHWPELRALMNLPA
jgi:serine/threonine-protein kinase